FIGMFFNLFGPSTLGGDLVRALYLGAGGRRRLAISSVVFDRASGLALLVALGAFGFLLFPEYRFPRSLILGTVAVGGLLVAGWWAAPRLVWLLPATRWTRELRREVEVDLAPLWRDRRLLGGIALVSVVFHLTQVAAQYVLARAVGAQLPFSYCLIFHPVISVMTALPVSVNGVGVREGGYLYFLTRIDVDDSIAITLSLLSFAVTVLGGLLGGAVFLISGATLPALRAPASKQAGAAA
ncbi:MAG TPA: lysylphosphatidylglycerol synthase transmembrane domain-containing protein, partial [Solirubrobacteraceae bacterium]